MVSAETKVCQNCHNQFTVEPDDFVFYEKIKVPPPTFCPECRLKRKMIFRNFKTLYKRNSDRSLKPVISMYSPRVPYKVYTHEEWWADDWDPKSYGRNFDFDRPFFEQFQELLLVVPRFNVMNTQSQNCEYSNMVRKSKNCYLVFGCVDTEDSAYGHIVWECKDSLDNLYLYKSELCYECVDCVLSYRLFYSQECESCTESVGLYDCRSCANCIGCVGLKQKSYYVFNENVGKAGYEQFLKDHPISDPGTIPFILKKQMELRKKLPQRHFFGSHNTNISGNHIYHSKNAHYSFDIKENEDVKSIFTGGKVIDSYDAAFNGGGVELAYDVLTSNGRGVYFSHNAWDSTDVYYSDNCYNCHNIFGCEGLKGGEYLILNKQYPKEEYETLVQKIIEHMKKAGEWGEFFPKELSPFAYNESIINEYYPLSREEALKQGYRWVDEIPSTVGQETIPYATLPQNPAQYSEVLMKEIMKCETCGKNYRFILKEIQFHKQMNLPLPRECFNCRHAWRMSLRNPRALWNGACAKCGAAFQTSYPPEKQKEFKIYCEICYQNEVG